MKLSQSEVTTIGIFRALNLGDFLCAVPAIRAIRTAYPNAEITYIGLSGTKELVGRYPQYIDKFIAFPGFPGLPEQAFDRNKFEAFKNRIQNKFDLLLQMQGNGTIVNRMLQSFNAVQNAGFTPGASNELFLTYPNYGHEVHRHLKLIKHLNIALQGDELEFPLSEKDFKQLDELQLDISHRKYVCIHPGSRGSWRQWPPIHFASVADYCASKGYAVILTGTEQEKGLVNHVAAYIKTDFMNCAGKTSLGALGALIKGSRLLISNCTGVSHVAAALQVKSLVISMDGEPDRWGPLNQKLHTTIDWRINNYDTVLNQIDNLLI